MDWTKAGSWARGWQILALVDEASLSCLVFTAIILPPEGFKNCVFKIVTIIINNGKWFAIPEERISPRSCKRGQSNCVNHVDTSEMKGDPTLELRWSILAAQAWKLAL